MTLLRNATGKLVPLIAVLAVLPILLAQSGRRVLGGHVRPFAIAANDLGRVDASMKLGQVTLILEPSAAQQADLTAFLASQQDPASPNYHQWLTPEQYGERFGLPAAAIDQIRSWLAGQNLTVDSVGRGRTMIAFSGNVRDVERALQIEIHNYRVGGVTHFANANEPSVPAAIGAFIASIRGLDDIRLKPRSIRAATPLLKVPSYTSVITGANYLAPGDMATIFNIAPLYNSGITGKGQKIAVVGQTAINLSDIEAFRTYFNLSANDPTVLLAPGNTDPGISDNDLPEADLDIEWAGAIAKDASITYVYAPNVETALNYAIDQNLAPVISMSYGLCEPLAGFSDLNSLNSFAQQASAQGISWIAATGDSGANDCYGDASNAPSGLSVDAPASVPGVTGVGGTTLTEGASTYWNSLNDANHASAISYIPENVWNDSVLDGTPSAGGGGASIFFPKPAWQTGTGVPTDSERDVPDIAMPASPDHDPFLVYSAGTLQAFGGTSVGAPVIAGIAGLLNQYLVANGFQKSAGAGNLNPRLYALAQESPNAFHDITAGNNMVVPCASKTCASLPLVGFNAGVGYDEASGLGSVDAFNLVTGWPVPGGTVTSWPTVQLSFGASSLAPGDSTTLTAVVTGVTAATGSVAFWAGDVPLGSSPLGSNFHATLAGVQAETLIAGMPEATNGGFTTEVTAIYSNGAYELAEATATITVVSPNAMVLSGVTSAASFQKLYAPGMVVALFGQNLATSTPDPPESPLPTQLAGTSVTINGIGAPLYYVSPTQINLQIPWEIPRNSSAVFKVSANGQTATSQVFIDTHAPEIFGDANSLLVPYQTTGRGQTIFLFATGDGLFSAPVVTTGAVPASGTLSTLPGSATVTVGGVAAVTTFVGEPSWSIGVSQINFTIPPNAPLGVQPVIVNVGGALSAPVYITVTR